MAVNPPTLSFQPVATAPPGVYCNAVQILMSPYEFNIELAQLAPQSNIAVPPDSHSGAEPVEAAITGIEIHKHVVANVVMSPQHAKALLKALAQNVEKYEADNGPLPEPPDPPNLGGAAQ